jgi:3-carboxy-cis,cis-muconate cycloisomerase
MAATLAAAGDAVLAEQRSVTGLVEGEPAPTYLGDAVAYVGDVVARAEETVG